MEIDRGPVRGLQRTADAMTLDLAWLVDPLAGADTTEAILRHFYAAMLAVGRLRRALLELETAIADANVRPNTGFGSVVVMDE